MPRLWRHARRVVRKNSVTRSKSQAEVAAFEVAAAPAQSHARPGTKARATFDTSKECVAWEPDGSISQFSLLCFFRCLSLRRWHKSFLRSISALSMRMRGTESYSIPKHMGNECPLLFASV